MKKWALMTLVLALSGVASAKTLTVQCTSAGEQLNMVSDIANVNTPQVIKSVEVNGVAVRARDVSQMPIYQGNGGFKIEIQYGTSFYSSAEMELKSCTDSFEATGTASLNKYVGGFVGTMKKSLTCSCELK